MRQTLDMADNKLTKSAGEHWTCAMLSRRGWSPALTRDGIARTDILAVATHIESRPTIEVQVKSANGSSDKTSWMLGAKAQDADRSGHEWFVLVALPPMPAPPRGFVVPRDHVWGAVWVVHQNWLTEPGIPLGRRNAPMSQARTNLEVFAKYEDRWDLLDQPTSLALVLLPPWIRSKAREEGVGLPPNHPWNTHLPTW
jgi:hypothetical protein